MNSYRPEIRDELVIGQVDDDVLVYDPVSDRTTVLNVSAAAVLALCDGERTVDQIIAEVGRAVPAPGGALGIEIEDTVRSLVANGLFANAPLQSGREQQPAQAHSSLSGLSWHSPEPYELELKRHRRALVCYLDEAAALIKQGKALLESLIYIDAQDTDLILFGPPAALQQFPDYPLVTKISQQRHFLAAEYGYINSIACLAGPGSKLLDHYGYLLKTDLDVFLTPAWNNFRPEQLTTGPGWYSHTDEVRAKCRKIAAKFGLNHYGKHNLGSTFYGPPEKVRDVCRLATMLCEYLLTDEFATEHGSWPDWYREVATMYATEIALNHLVGELVTTSSQLDAYSTSSNSVTDYAHVHCWHTHGWFTKSEWEAGYYASVDVSQLDMKIVRDYCMAMALRVSANQDQASLSRPGKTYAGDHLATFSRRATCQQTPSGNIHPLSFCIPDEYIVYEPPPKTQVWAEVIPGETLTHRFGPEQEGEYDAMYRDSRFAFTTRRGGWDCLRHYEILAAGAIPVFADLKHCPAHTLTTFPKGLVIRAQHELLPWRPESADKYEEIVRELLLHVRAHCSTSAAVQRLLGHFPDMSVRRVLLLRTDPDPSYGRELLWIGLYRYLTAIGGRALYYPENDFLFDDYPVEACQRIHGAGFKYARKLKRAQAQAEAWDDARVRQSIQRREWDLVIYGKIGPDEGPMGSFPGLPFWETVCANYGPSRTVFLYIGDAAQDMRSESRYNAHLRAHAPYAQCFVRELIL